MSPAVEPSIIELVLTEIRQIRESIDELRDELHNKLGQNAVALAALSQWRESHEKVADTNAARLTAVEQVQSEQRGAIKALRWLAAGIAAGLGVLEAWLHSARLP